MVLLIDRNQRFFDSIEQLTECLVNLWTYWL